MYNIGMVDRFAQLKFIRAYGIYSLSAKDRAWNPNVVDAFVHSLYVNIKITDDGNCGNKVDLLYCKFPCVQVQKKWSLSDVLNVWNLQVRCCLASHTILRFSDFTLLHVLHVLFANPAKLVMFVDLRHSFFIRRPINGDDCYPG